MKKLLFYTSIISLAIVSFFSCNKDPEIDIDNPDKPTVPEESELIFPKKEMRAVWIATVWGLDWPMEKYDPEVQKRQYITYLDKLKELNMNAVFFQVKGMGDAFYNSPYEPWCKWITGDRGKDPRYDVLAFMIEEAHARDIEFHAWMNPYRIATRTNNATPYPELHRSVKPEWVLSHEKIQIYNPALPEVRQRLADIVKDLITKYDVDGIHFDDYFYPDPSSAGTMVSDKQDYEKYGAEFSSIEDFRRANVDKTIKGVYDAIVATKPEVVFSVSPAANPDYSLKTLYADVSKWCKEGWVDILIPQLYQEIGNSYNDFQTRLNWWSQYNGKALLMVGHALYKFGDGTSPSAFQSTQELDRQFELTKRNKKVVGNAMYSARYLLFNKIEITDKLASIYKNEAVIPFAGRSVAPAPSEAKDIKIENNRLIWNTTGDVKSIVYYFSDLKKEGQVLGMTKDNSMDVKLAGHYCITTMNKDNKESNPSELIEKK